MKKRIIKIITVLIVTALSFLIINGTFFKTKYNKELPIPRFSILIEKTDNSITIKTLKSKQKTELFINEYIENLSSCYDESRFYDEENNITITKYAIEKNLIEIEYSLNNQCENEYVLDETHFSEIKNNATITEAIITKCSKTGQTQSCNNKNIEDLSDIFDIEKTRIQEKNNINLPEENTYLINVTYILNNNAYTLEMGSYNITQKEILYKVIDANDHPLNALYKLEISPNEYLEEIYNKN